VDGQRDIDGAVAQRQRGDIGVEQRRVRCRPEHPHRQVAADGHGLPVPQRAQVRAVAAASIQHPQPGRQPGQVHDPSDDVEIRVLMPPEPLASAQVPVIGVLGGRVQRHHTTMPRAAARRWVRRLDPHVGFRSHR
jgi:hypothetical protein